MCSHIKSLLYVSFKGKYRKYRVTVVFNNCFPLTKFPNSKIQLQKQKTTFIYLFIACFWSVFLVYFCFICASVLFYFIFSKNWTQALTILDQIIICNSMACHWNDRQKLQRRYFRAQLPVFPSMIPGQPANWLVFTLKH